jgi:hypothetical protein
MLLAVRISITMQDWQFLKEVMMMMMMMMIPSKMSKDMNCEYTLTADNVQQLGPL